MLKFVHKNLVDFNRYCNTKDDRLLTVKIQVRK